MNKILLSSIIVVVILILVQSDVNKVEGTETTQASSQSLTINNLQEAINYSGKTRMLSMRTANQYGFQVCEKMDDERKEEAKKHLAQAQKMMNDIYAALLVYPTIADQEKLKKVVEDGLEVWRRMEKMLTIQPTIAGFQDIIALSDTLLGKNEAIVKALEEQSSGAKGKLVNIAGRQRMYSMKLARDYLAVSMGIDKEHRMELMLETADKFENAMHVMKDATDNTDKIKGTLKSISRMEWRVAYKSVNEFVKSKGVKYDVVMMFLYCERLLEKTNRLTGLYASL